MIIMSNFNVLLFYSFCLLNVCLATDSVSVENSFVVSVQFVEAGSEREEENANSVNDGEDETLNNEGKSESYKN